MSSRYDDTLFGLHEDLGPEWDALLGPIEDADDLFEALVPTLGGKQLHMRILETAAEYDGATRLGLVRWVETHKPLPAGMQDDV